MLVFLGWVSTGLVQVQYLTNFFFLFNFLKELMTKLITETPDQPIPFLIDHLQSKQGNRGQLQRTLSGSAALWAESETSGMFCVLERATLQYNLPILMSMISRMHVHLLTGTALCSWACRINPVCPSDTEFNIHCHLSAQPIYMSCEYGSELQNANSPSLNERDSLAVLFVFLFPPMVYLCLR